VRLLLLDLLTGHTGVSDLPENALLIHDCRDNAPEQDIQTGIDVVGTRLALHSAGKLNSKMACQDTTVQVCCRGICSLGESPANRSPYAGLTMGDRAHPAAVACARVQVEEGGSRVYVRVRARFRIEIRVRVST